MPLRLKLLFHSASQEAEDSICRRVRWFQMGTLVLIEAHGLMTGFNSMQLRCECLGMAQGTSAP